MVTCPTFARGLIRPLLLATAFASAAIPTAALSNTPVSPPTTARPDYRQAAPGDVLQVRLSELRPTQAAIGYDQLSYTLGRWQGDADRPTWRNAPQRHWQYLHETIGKKFDDYCDTNGGGGLAESSLRTVEALRAARLDDPDSFACASAPGTHREALKSVVVGWDDQLYLTDGHHSFSSLWEVADGGPELPVWVRVDENASAISDAAAFWQHLVAARKAWLRDGNNQPVAPEQLPTRLGMVHDGVAGGLQDDPYRSLVYFARGIGYANDALPEFAEFLWADWLRGRLDLAQYRLGPPATLDEILSGSGFSLATLGPQGSDNSYPAAVRDAALAMAQATPDTRVFQDLTAHDLGQQPLYANARRSSATAQARTNLERLDRDDTARNGTPRTGGRLWYSVNYAVCGRPRAGTECWGY